MGERTSFERRGITEAGSGFHRHDTPTRNASEADPVSADYDELTEGGVAHARLVAREDILHTLERAPDGAVLFIGGKSDQARTGQTGEVWGQELAAVATERNDLVVLTKNHIEEMRAAALATRGKAVHAVRQIIAENPGKKIVIDYPLFIGELGFEDRWTRKNPENGKLEKTEYFVELLKKHDNDHARCIADWLQNEGLLTLDDGRMVQGPRPEDVAKQYLQGLEKLYQFTKKQVPDRPVLVHAVGHQWDLDAVATYLAKGRVTYEGWQEVMGRPDGSPKEQVIGEGEGVGDVLFDPTTGKTAVTYRGKEFRFLPQESKE